MGSKPKIIRKENLTGKTVIIIRGFTYANWGKWIRDPKNGVKFIETSSHELAFEMLEKRRADYLLTYKYLSQYVLKNKKIKNLFYSSLFNSKCYFILSNKTPNQKNILKKIDDSYQFLIKKKILKQLD